MADELDVVLELDAAFEWRLEQLERHFPRFVAFRLAMTEGDWHKAVRMKNLGFTDDQILNEFLDE
jgi:hypothetical protein